MKPPARRAWSDDEIKLLGKLPDRQVARRLGRSYEGVQLKRLHLKIKNWRVIPKKAASLDPEKTRLRFGPYAPPRTRRGAFLFCEMRGTVKVGDYTDGPIPWPIKWGTRSPILSADLVRAVQQESELAVAHHWGVCPGTVTKWRNALEVGPITEGTRQVKSYNTTEAMTPALRAHLSALKTGKPSNLSPSGRRRLMAALHRPKPEHWFKSMAPHFAARRGKPVDPNDKPWTPEEERLVGTRPDKEIARLLNRSIGAVTAHRFLKNIEYVNPKLRPWKDSELALIGKVPDAQIAAQTGHSLKSVQTKRQDMGLLVRPHWRPWTRREEALLGTKPDTQLAKLLGRERTEVRLRRAALGIPPAPIHSLYNYWTPEEDKLLGTASDRAVANLVGRSLGCVQGRRLRLGLISFRASKARARAATPKPTQSS